MDRTGSKNTAVGGPAHQESDRPCCHHDGEQHTEESVHDAWIGRRLGGRYQVDGKIGEGASGAVYLAHDSVLCDRVAVKIVCLEDLPSSDAARSQLERVQREVQAVASISHPHLVRFIDFIELGETHAGIVTDYVDGETLEALLDREGRLPVGRAVDIAVQVAMATGAMHSRHIVHRDLKPANIIVEQLPGQGDYCQLIDFGVVRYEDEVARTNAFLGTPLYASPEQATNGDIDHRSDVYSLGTILFEMLTGRPPFEESRAFAALMAHSQHEPPSLGEAAPGCVFPAWLESLVGAMLAKSPDARVATMAEVVRRLRPDQERTLFSESRVVSLSGDASQERLVYVEGDHEVFEQQQCPGGDAHPIWELDDHVTALAAGRSAIIAGTRKGTVERLEMTDGTSETLFDATGIDAVSAVAIANDGSVVAAFESGRVYLLRRTAAGQPWVKLPEGEPVTAVAISSESGAVLVTRQNRRSHVYIIEQSLSRPSLTIEHNSPVERIDFSGDGFLIGAKGLEGGLKIYSIANGVLLTDQTACPYSASPDRAACPRHEQCPIAKSASLSSSQG